jgi:hypothetical protein
MRIQDTKYHESSRGRFTRKERSILGRKPTAEGVKEAASTRDMSFALWRLYLLMVSLSILTWRQFYFLTSSSKADGSAQCNGEEDGGGGI